MTVVIAVIRARAQVTRSALVPREAVASPVVTIALVVTVGRTLHQGAIEAIEPILASTGHVRSANAIARTVVGTHARLALHTGIASFALAYAIGTQPVVVTVIRASAQRAILA